MKRLWFFLILVVLAAPLRAYDEDEDTPHTLRRAFLYQEGDKTKGIPHDYKKAFNVFKAITEDPTNEDYASACFYVGLYYDVGWGGISESLPLAAYWYL